MAELEFTTAADVASHLKLAAPDALATSAAAAVNAMLAGREDLVVVVDAEAGTVEPSAAAKLGATMLAARLHRRRNTPFGVEAIDGTAASTMARNDPDVARLLGLDWHTAPGVG